MAWRWFKKYWWLIAIIVALFIVFQIVHYNCKITMPEIESNPSVLSWSWAKQNIFLCQKEIVFVEHPFQWSYNSARDFLGANRDIYNFIFPDLICGLIAGLFITVLYFIAESEYGILKHITFLEDIYLSPSNSTWFKFIGSAFWKIIPIGVLYAVFMQVPIINTVINAITFHWLLQLKGWLMPYLIKPFLIAFYIGFLPSAMEAYSKYKIRKKYYNALMRAKYERQAVKEMTGG